MAKEKDPAFLWYSKDWIEGTAEMMPDEKGVFADLLSHQHQKGDLPNDTNRLARIVGLGHEEFVRIWKVVGEKFKPKTEPNGEQNADRLVNRKLNRLMTERSEKGHRNSIIGSFAAVLRKGSFAQKDVKILKESFKVDDFDRTPTEKLTERLTEWCEERLKSIGNENGNNTKKKSISVDEYIEQYKQELTDIFNSDVELKKAAKEWLDYKWRRKEYYTSTLWASLMVKRSSQTDTQFICEKIREAIAKESTQDYFYDNMLIDYQRMRGSPNNQKTGKLESTNDVFGKLLNENATGQQIGHQEGSTIRIG